MGYRKSIKLSIFIFDALNVIYYIRCNLKRGFKNEITYERKIIRDTTYEINYQYDSNNVLTSKSVCTDNNLCKDITYYENSTNIRSISLSKDHPNKDHSYIEVENISLTGYYETGELQYVWNYKNNKIINQIGYDVNNLVSFKSIPNKQKTGIIGYINYETDYDGVIGDITSIEKSNGDMCKITNKHGSVIYNGLVNDEHCSWAK